MALAAWSHAHRAQQRGLKTTSCESADAAPRPAESYADLALKKSHPMFVS